MRIKDQEVKTMTAVELFRCNVEAAMGRSGITQQEVADAAGIAQATLSRAMSGVNSPTLTTCEKIATGLGLPLSSLISGPLKKSRQST